MTQHADTVDDVSSAPKRVRWLLLLPLALCPLVMVAGPKLLVGALPAGIVGLALVRLLEWKAASAGPGKATGSARASSWRPAAASLIMIALLAWAGVTIPWSDRPDKSFDYWTHLALVAGFLVLALEVSGHPLSDRLGRRFMLWIWGALALTAGVTALNLATNLPLLRALHDAGIMTDRVSPPVLNRTLTFLVLMLWPMLAWLVLRPFRPWLGGAALVLAGLSAAAILLGQSNAAMLALVVGAMTAVCALLTPPNLLRHGLRAILVLTVLVGPWALTHGLPQMRDALDPLPRSAQARAEILALYAAPLAERPLVGWGLASATTVPKTPVAENGSAFYRIIDPQDMTVHPHNNFVQIWIDLGVVGILPVLALGWLAIDWISRQSSAGRRACGAAALLCVLMVACTAYGIWQADWLAQVVLCVLLFRLGCSEHGAAPGAQA